MEINVCIANNSVHTSTTNAAEGYHYSLNCRFRTNHPTVWKFVDRLREEEQMVFI